MAADPAIVDMLELVINRLIDTTPAPPTIAAEDTHDAAARKAYADEVTAWSYLLGKRFRAAKDLCDAVGVTVPWSLKTLDDLLGVLPLPEDHADDEARREFESTQL